MSHKRYLFLDGMRGVAAIAITLFHISIFSKLGLAPSGYLAVDLFFCLSGFVLSNAYSAKIGAGMGFGTFARIRILRLYPMYIIGLLLGTLVFVLMYADGFSTLTYGMIVKSALLHLFYLPYLATETKIDVYVNSASYPLNAPFWSLFCEMFLSAVFFYLCRWSLQKQKLLWCFAGLFMLIFSNPVAYAMQSTFFIQPPRALYPFITGMMLYHYRGVLERGLPVRYIGLFTLVTFAPFCFYSPSYLANAQFQLCYVVLLAPLTMIMGMNIEAHEMTRTVALNNFLGRISYPLYCVHFPVLNLFLWLSCRGSNGAIHSLSIAGALSVLVVSLLLAQLCAVFVEPWLRLKFKNAVTR